MIAKSASKSVHSVKCGICRAEIVDRAQIYQAGINLGVVCVGCYKQFSPEDLEMMGNLFIAYGGYFGMQKDSDFSIIKTLENVLGEEKAINAERVNIRLMHEALLHGVSPEQHIQNLTLLVDE